MNPTKNNFVMTDGVTLLEAASEFRQPSNSR